MNSMSLLFRARRHLRFPSALQCAAGVTSIEYALIAFLVSIAAITGYMVLVGALDANYYSLIGSIPR